MTSKKDTTEASKLDIAKRVVWNVLHAQKCALEAYESGKPEPAVDNVGSNLDISIAALEALATSDDAIEGFAANLQKRDPQLFRWQARES